MIPQRNWPIIGHPKIINFLKESIKAGNLSHAYLFTGPSHLGKTTLAKFFAQTLQCEKPSFLKACEKCRSCELIQKNSSPDTIIIDKEERLKIETIREIQHQLSLRHYSAPYKIVILAGAHLMTPEAANCLLKTLEEPPRATILILISPHLDSLLETIVSRCQILSFLPVPTSTLKEGLLALKKDRKLVEYLSSMVAGRPGLALEILEDPSAWQEQIRILDKFLEIKNKGEANRLNFVQYLLSTNLNIERILDFWLSFIRDVMVSSLGAEDLISTSFLKEKIKRWPTSDIREIISHLEKISWTKETFKTNINRRLALENLILSF